MSLNPDPQDQNDGLWAMGDVGSDLKANEGYRRVEPWDLSYLLIILQIC